MKARTGHAHPLAVVAVGLVILIAGTALAQSSNSSLGTWKLNVAKSTYDAGTAPKSLTITNEAAGAGVKSTSDGVTGDGTVVRREYTVNYDGKDYVTGDLSRDGVAVTRVDTRVDANTVKTIYKRGGTVTTTMTAVVSSDGKTMTCTIQITSERGQTFTSVAVFDKQ
jgi:hypothetical protein